MTLIRRPRFRRPRWRPLVRRLHLWASLALGAILLVVVVSGAIVLFDPEIHQLTEPQLYEATEGEPVPPSTALATVNRELPEFEANTVVRNRGIYDVPDKRFEEHAFVDPGTGELNGTSDPNRGFMGVLKNLHMCGLSCKEYSGYVPFLKNKVEVLGNRLTIGGLVLGITGLALLFMSISGLFLWWPGLKRFARGFKIRRKRGSYSTHYDLHKVVGFVAIPFLVMWAVTGMGFEFKQVKEAWYGVLPGEKPTGEEVFATFASKPPGRGGDDIGPAAAEAAALASHPGSKRGLGDASAGGRQEGLLRRLDRRRRRLLRLLPVAGHRRGRGRPLERARQDRLPRQGRPPAQPGDLGRLELHGPRRHPGRLAAAPRLARVRPRAHPARGHRRLDVADQAPPAQAEAAARAAARHPGREAPLRARARGRGRAGARSDGARVSGRLAATISLYAVFCAAVLAFGAVAGRERGPLELASLAALELALVAQAVGAVIALAGGERASEPATFGGYLVASVAILPLVGGLHPRPGLALGGRRARRRLPRARRGELAPRRHLGRMSAGDGLDRGRALALVYAIFALAAGARSAVQIATGFGEAPLAYLLSAFAAAVYLVAALTLGRPGRRAILTGTVACAVELAGVLIVGGLSVADPGSLPGRDRLVWLRQRLRLYPARPPGPRPRLAAEPPPGRAGGANRGPRGFLVASRPRSPLGFHAI